jgi:hypothetical protein
MKTLITFGLGALTMYLLDPQQGPRRRAVLRHRLTYLSNRARVAEETRRRVRTELELDKPSETPGSAHHLGR